MALLQEVAVTSCLNDTAISAYVWDVQTGTSLTVYRGDTAIAPVGLSLLCNEYIMAALQDKPFLRVWAVNSQQALSNVRLVCPGRVSHVQASPDSCYIALTVAEKLHIYQVASGRLVATGSRHFQPVRVLRWSADGSHVVCGGEDGLVTVWTLVTLTGSQNAPEPRHVLSDHTLPVTDIALTAAVRPRLLSVSADRTCKIYDLYQGALLVSVVCDSVLTAVTSGPLETDVFIGTDSGAILQLGLLSPPRQLEYHLTSEESALVFTGHTKAVRCLSTSLNGDLLMSGSTDGSVRIWHISSRQCLRTIPHKGPVTNAFFSLKPKQMFDNELKPSVVLSSFKVGNSEESDCLEVITQHSLRLCDDSVRELFPKPTGSGSEDKVKSLQIEIDLLRSINSSLYKFTVDKIIESNASDVVEPVQRSKKKKKNKVEDTLVNDSLCVDQSKLDTNSIVSSVNGFPKHKKRRKRKRNKI